MNECDCPRSQLGEHFNQCDTGRPFQTKAGKVVRSANSRWPLFAGTWRDFVVAKSVMRLQDVYRCAGLL